MNKKFTLLATCIVMFSAIQISPAEESLRATLTDRNTMAQEASEFTSAKEAADFLNAHRQQHEHGVILKHLRPEILEQLPSHKLNNDVTFSFSVSSHSDKLSPEQKTALYKQLSPEDAQYLIKNTTLGDEIEAARSSVTPEPNKAAAAAPDDAFNQQDDVANEAAAAPDTAIDQQDDVANEAAAAPDDAVNQQDDAPVVEQAKNISTTQAALRLLTAYPDMMDDILANLQPTILAELPKTEGFNENIAAAFTRSPEIMKEFTSQERISIYSKLSDQDADNLKQEADFLLNDETKVNEIKQGQEKATEVLLKKISQDPKVIPSLTQEDIERILRYKGPIVISSPVLREVLRQVNTDTAESYLKTVSTSNLRVIGTVLETHPELIAKLNINPNDASSSYARVLRINKQVQTALKDYNLKNQESEQAQPAAAAAAAAPAKVLGLQLRLNSPSDLFAGEDSPASPAATRPESPVRSLTYDSMRPDDIVQLRKAAPEEILTKIKNSSTNALTLGTIAKNLRYLTSKQAEAIISRPDAPELDPVILRGLLPRLAPDAAEAFIKTTLPKWDDSSTAIKVALEALTPEVLRKYLSKDELTKYKTIITQSLQLMHNLSPEQRAYLTPPAQTEG